MKITDVRADFLKTGRTLLRIFTDDGLVGLAEAGWGHDRIFLAWLDEVEQQLFQLRLLPAR